MTIVEYAAPTCPHCAAFNRDVFPKIKAEYVDTGKVRYVFREFPLNIKDVACSMLTRTIAKDGDSVKYFAGRRRHVQPAGPAGGERPRIRCRLIGKQAGLQSHRPSRIA